MWAYIFGYKDISACYSHLVKAFIDANRSSHGPPSHHWLHPRLSFWQPWVKPVIKRSSLWQPFGFSVYATNLFHYPLQWCHMSTMVSSLWQLCCLLNIMFMLTRRKTSQLHNTGDLWGDSPPQRTIDVGSVSISLFHQLHCLIAVNTCFPTQHGNP